jgi:tellurium resistance protein TerZ
VDLDVTAVLYDNTGTIVDACYYSQLEICSGAVKHSGDNRTGEGAGDDEVITLDLDALDGAIKVIMFVVTAHSGGSFASVESARWELRDLSKAGKTKIQGDSLY